MLQDGRDHHSELTKGLARIDIGWDYTGLQTSSHSACGGTRVEESPESQSALKAMQEAVWAVGKSASLQVQLEALSGALKQAGEAQRAKSRAISQYEWMHEAVLGAAGLLGPPIQLTQQVHTASAKPPVLTGYI